MVNVEDLQREFIGRVGNVEQSGKENWEEELKIWKEFKFKTNFERKVV